MKKSVLRINKEPSFMFDKGKLYPDNNFSKHYIIDQHRKVYLID